MAPSGPNQDQLNELGKKMASSEINFLQSNDVELTPPTPTKLSPEFIQQVQQYLNRKKNEKRDSEQTRAKKLKAKKAARKRSNKSRKINQAKSRKNKFTK